MLQSISPATEQPFGDDYLVHGPHEVESHLRRAADTFPTWRRTGISARASLVRRAATLLRDRAADLAKLMALEMGKPVTAGEAEAHKCAACCDHFAEHAPAYLADETITSGASRSYVRYEPLGAVLAIMPWNFPFWQVVRFAAPALMAGNVAVLKHAPNVSGCADAIESIFKDAGFPEGTFVNLRLANEDVEAVIRHEAIAAVTLTGSTRAGKAVASQAGSEIKKTVLELGGSDAFIVLADADVEATAKAAADARCINSGQSCIAAKRFIVEAAIYEPFERAFAAALAHLKVGDPFDRATQVGPLARRDLLDNLVDQVERSIAGGARLVTGGKRLPGKGCFYPPTLLADVRPGMAAFDEETFGPVAALIRADDADHAVRLANQSIYGLGASIWTRDIALAERLAGQIESGCVFINGPVQSDPRLPFGGIKQSGYGRELSALGNREFVNAKTVWVKEAQQASPLPASE